VCARGKGLKSGRLQGCLGQVAVVVERQGRAGGRVGCGGVCCGSVCMRVEGSNRVAMCVVGALSESCQLKMIEEARGTFLPSSRKSCLPMLPAVFHIVVVLSAPVVPVLCFMSPPQYRVLLPSLPMI